VVPRLLCPLLTAKPSGTECAEGLPRSSGLLAAVALQHVHWVNWDVVSANFVLVHVRLLNSFVGRGSKTIYRE